MDKNIFYIMAPGLSINDVTDEEWKFLENKNTVSFSQFVYSNKKTKYHFSYEDYWSDKNHLNQMKNNEFLDTNLLLGIPKTIKYAKSIGFDRIYPIIKGPAMPFKGQSWTTDQEEPICKFKECRAFRFNQSLFRYRGSLSSVINAALILRAKEIRLVGVDLNSQYYFFDKEPDRWIRNEDDKKVIKETLDLQNHLINKRKRVPTTITDFNPEKINDTNMPYGYHGKILRNMSDVVVWMDKELREEGLKGIYTTSKKSDLYNRLEYKEIMDE